MSKESANVFPPRPVGLKGRETEVRTLTRLLQPRAGARVALVGSGGSGKSMLAAAVAHRVRRRFDGGAHWFRSGPWDASTLVEMMAIRFGARAPGRAARLKALRSALGSRGPSLVVLDNHENDAAVATLVNDLASAPVTWMLTARRCLLSGVTIFPVTAPRAISGLAAFARVRELTPWLRQNPLALDIADALVASRAASVAQLVRWLSDRKVHELRAMEHEDDLPEVALLVEWAWARLSRAGRRMMAVLAATSGDHVDAESLAKLAGIRGDREARGAIADLARWHLVQSPLADRYALHAVVRFAVLRRTTFPSDRFVEHYVRLLERAPERLDLEQTHLYAVMDHAHTHSRLDWMLRIERLLALLAESEPE